MASGNRVVTVDAIGASGHRHPNARKTGMRRGPRLSGHRRNNPSGGYNLSNENSGPLFDAYCLLSLWRADKTAAALCAPSPIHANTNNSDAIGSATGYDWQW